MTSDELLKSVSRVLATKQLSSEQLSAITTAMNKSKFPILGVDICTTGICIDIGVDGPLATLDIRKIIEVATGPIRNIEIFPEGIIVPDRARVRLTHTL